MNTYKISNITLAELRIFLRYYGLTKCDDTKGRGGHEKWEKRRTIKTSYIFKSYRPGT